MLLERCYLLRKFIVFRYFFGNTSIQIAPQFLGQLAALMQLDPAMDKLSQIFNAILECRELFEPVI